MLDLTAVRMRYYPVKLNGRVLELEPPKMKTVNRLVAVSKDVANGNLESYDEFTLLVARVLSKNRTGYTVTPEFVEDSLTLDQVAELLGGYFHWLNEEKRDPN